MFPKFKMAEVSGIKSRSQEVFLLEMFYFSLINSLKYISKIWDQKSFTCDFIFENVLSFKQRKKKNRNGTKSYFIIGADENVGNFCKQAPPLFLAKHGVTAWYPQITPTTTLLRYCSKQFTPQKKQQGKLFTFLYTQFILSHNIMIACALC